VSPVGLKVAEPGCPDRYQSSRVLAPAGKRPAGKRLRVDRVWSVAVFKICVHLAPEPDRAHLGEGLIRLKGTLLGRHQFRQGSGPCPGLRDSGGRLVEVDRSLLEAASWTGALGRCFPHRAAEGRWSLT